MPTTDEQRLLTRDESKLINETLFEKLASSDPLQHKQADDSMSDFTRTKVREDSIIEKIMPGLPIANSDLTRDFTQEPMRIEDLEPDSPAAISVGFASMPEQVYIGGNRYKVGFGRFLTPRFSVDVNQLRTWIMDIRQVLSNNAIKDMLAEQDGKALGAVDTAMGTIDVANATSGVVQYATINGGVTRESLADSWKLMPGTASNIETATVLINQITVKDLLKLRFNDLGGPMSQDIMRNGWTWETINGVRVLVTIKKALVATNYSYMFGDPKFLGRHYVLEDVTLAVKHEFYMLDFFAYKTAGMTWANTNALAKAYFV